MSELKNVRIGLIGCGNIAPLHVRSLLPLSNVEISALADPNAANVAALQAEFPALKAAKVFSSHQEILEADIDGVVIMTPHSLHYQQIHDALQAGKHVLTEKPFVVQPTQARELIALARENGKILMVSYQVARLWQYRYARQQIASGALGEILFYSSQITQHWGRFGGWRHTPTMSEGGMLVDTGSHFVDLMLYLTAMKPEMVTAFGQSEADMPIDDPLRTQQAAVDLITGAVLQFNGGRIATLGVVGRGPTLWNITIVGTKGTIEFIDRDQIRHIASNNYEGWIGTERRNLVPLTEAGKPAPTPDEEFVMAMQQGDLSVADAQRGLVVAQLTQSILESVREGGKPIPVGALG